MSSDNDIGLASRAWFRPAVGLWFGMLVGAGTLGVLYVTPPATRDALFQQTGLSALHRFFEPPVGMAGFAAVAIVAGLLGLLLGLVVAGRLTRPSQNEEWDEWEEPEYSGEEDEPEAEEEVRHRVFSARDDIGEDGIAITQTAEETEEAEAAEGADPGDEPEIVHAAEDQDPIETPHAPTRPAPQRTPLADLSLDQLTQRLGEALEASKASGQPRPVGNPGEDPEHVISFLRREASRSGAETAEEGGDPQAALRSALDKLGRVGKPD